MIKAQCHCGAVQIELSGKPAYMNDCDCSLCRKSGAVWGYYAAREMIVRGATQTYTRADMPDPAIHLHFCATCGSVTHWTLAAAYQAQHPDVDRAGVNMRLLDDGRALAGVELRFPDGRAWDGSTATARQRRAASIVGNDGEF
jgi:hypothetical protein